MNALDSLNATAFTAFGQDVIWSDMTGNLAGLAALALSWRRSILSRPVQFLSGALLVAAYASAERGGGVGKQLLVITVALWGWRQWRPGGRSDAGDGQIAVRFATSTERGLLVAGAAVGTLAVGALFTAGPELSWNPWPDANFFTGTLMAMIAQARGLVEFWIARLLVDLVGVPLAFDSGLPFSGLVYLVYLVLVLWGMRDWWPRSRAAAVARPVLEGAAA